MKRTKLKSVILTLAFTVALFAGTNQTFAKTNENSNKAVKEIKVTVPDESKIKGTDNAKAHGGNAYSYGQAEDKLTGLENAKAHGGNAYAKEKVEEEEEAVEVEVTVAKVKAETPLLKGTENAKAHGGKTNAYGKAPDKLTGVENAKAHGGNAFAKGDAEIDEDEVVVADPTVALNEELAPVVKTPLLKGIENAKAHGGKAHAYGHCKKIEVMI